MKRVFCFCLALACLLSVTAFADFTDVADSGYDEKAIFDVSSFGIMQGYGDGTFAPDNTISRQEAAVILSRILPTAGSEKRG